MRKILKQTLLLILFVPALTTNAQQEKDSITLFLDRNPNVVDYNVISEGSKMYLAADDKYLFINISIADPTLQMRFLMQRPSLYIDPTGKKKKHYKIVLPSAPDVKEQMTMFSAGNQQKAEGMDDRPDIRPLVRALNYWGVDCHFNGESRHLDCQYFHVDHNPDDNLLNYYILLPKERLMQDKKLSDFWSIGISVVNDMKQTPPQPGMGGGPDGMMPPPGGGGRMPGGQGGMPSRGGADERGNQKSMQKIMQSDINSWTKFSIDDVNNVNLE